MSNEAGSPTLMSRRLGSFSTLDALLCVAILAGMMLRLWRLEAMEFKGDELTHMVGGYTALRAPWSAPFLATTAGVPLGPFFYQLLAVPLSVAQDPISVARFIALVNIAAIPLAFLLVRGMFDSRVALWTTALLATAPWMIFFSRKIWNPDLLIPFLVVTLLFLFSAMRRYAGWKTYGFAVSFALLTQLHLSVWLALLPLLPLGLLLRPWRRPIHLATGVALFLATHLVVLGRRTGELVAAFAGGPERAGTGLLWLAGHNARTSVRVASGTGSGYLLGPGGYAAFREQLVVPWAEAVFVLYAGLAGVATVFVIVRLASAARDSFRNRSDRFLLVLLLMAGSLHALYLFFQVAAFPHYVVVLALFPSLTVALLLRSVAERFGGAGALVARTLLLVVLAANVAFTAAFLAFVSTQPDAVDGDYGRPYAAERERWEHALAEEFAEVDARLGSAGTDPVPRP